jgi:methenyltetrahydromethanopterin cyclohydrolase
MHEALQRINPNAVRIAGEMERRAPEIGVIVSRLPGGARLIDAGVEAPGSHEAGRLFAEACLGGLGRVSIGTRPLGPATVAVAAVTVDAPLVACMASQYAGWKITAGSFFAMGSGPARALAAAEPLFEKLPLRARPPEEGAVLLLETTALPGEEVAAQVAARCGVPAARLTLVAAATGNLAGSTQIAARSVETALHKLLELGFDAATLVAGAGSCPIAPGHPDMLRAIGRTNDAVLYGAGVTLWARTEDRAIESVLDRLPSCASRDYGRLFHDLFREYGDFYKIDPMLFSPAQVTLVNAATGRVFSAGRTDETILIRSFGLAGAS